MTTTATTAITMTKGMTTTERSHPMDGDTRELRIGGGWRRIRRDYCMRDWRRALCPARSGPSAEGFTHAGCGDGSPPSRRGYGRRVQRRTRRVTKAMRPAMNSAPAQDTRPSRCSPPPASHPTFGVSTYSFSSREGTHVAKGPAPHGANVPWFRCTDGSDAVSVVRRRRSATATGNERRSVSYLRRGWRR